LYVFVLGKPESGKEIKLKKLNDIGYGPNSPVKRIIELKSGKEVEWTKEERYYTITAPNGSLDQYANVFKMELE